MSVKYTDHVRALAEAAAGKRDIVLHGTDNEGADAGTPYQVNLGTLIDYIAQKGTVGAIKNGAVSTDWFECNGQSLSRTEHPTLWAKIQNSDFRDETLAIDANSTEAETLAFYEHQSRFGLGDGTTTFTVPILSSCVLCVQ